MTEEYARIMADAESDRFILVAADCAQVSVIDSFMIFQAVRMLLYKSAITLKRACRSFGLGTSAIGSIFFIDGFYLFY